MTMSLSKFGAKVREYRRAYSVTLSTMASSLGASTAFLSAMETGRSKIPMDWVEKIANYFGEFGEKINVAELKAIACDDNEAVSLEGLRPQHRMLVAGFANSDLNQEQLTRLGRLLGEIYEENADDNNK